MNKIAYFWLTVTLTTLSFIVDSQFRYIEAQNRGEGSQEFFQEGEPQTEPESQEGENQQPSNPEPSQQQEEEKLEQNLNIQQRGPEIREAPGNTEAFDDAVPVSPSQEIPLIKF